MEEDQALYIPSMGKGCGLISHVTDPVLVRKSGKMFGFWTRDNGDLDNKSVFVMEHFYKNTKMDKYRSMSGNDTNFTSRLRSPEFLFTWTIFSSNKAFVNGQRENVFTLPSAWAGTGHLVLDSHVYFNRFNTSTITMVRQCNINYSLLHAVYDKLHSKIYDKLHVIN